MTGYTFTLENYPTAEVNQEYLLMQTLLFVQDNAQHSGQDQHFTFSTRFELHPTREVFRPQRTVSKPTPKGRRAPSSPARRARNLDGSVRAGKGTVWLGSLRQNG